MLLGWLNRQFLLITKKKRLESLMGVYLYLYIKWLFRMYFFPFNWLDWHSFFNKSRLFYYEWRAWLKSIYSTLNVYVNCRRDHRIAIAKRRKLLSNKYKSMECIIEQLIFYIMDWDFSFLVHQKWWHGIRFLDMYRNN